MKIIAHRGYWLKPEEKNSDTAFLRSIESGFGIETDIRDRNGELIVCHDTPQPSETYTSFNSFLEMYKRQADQEAVLAINIKSDGLHEMINYALHKHSISHYFCFDMSFPTLFFNYQNSRLKFFTSINEYSRQPMLIESAAGIWLDAYTSIWYDMNLVADFLKKGKSVCIVSPELHSRTHEELWRVIKQSGLYTHAELMLCTDFPAQARDYFK